MNSNIGISTPYKTLGSTPDEVDFKDDFFKWHSNATVGPFLCVDNVLLYSTGGGAVTHQRIISALQRSVHHNQNDDLDSYKIKFSKKLSISELDSISEKLTRIENKGGDSFRIHTKAGRLWKIRNDYVIVFWCGEDTITHDYLDLILKSYKIKNIFWAGINSDSYYEYGESVKQHSGKGITNTPRALKSKKYPHLSADEIIAILIKAHTSPTTMTRIEKEIVAEFRNDSSLKWNPHTGGFDIAAKYNYYSRMSESVGLKSFKEYIIETSTEGKNLHMTHIEDQVIYGGVKGAREAILALRSLRDMLAGNAKSSTDVTVKWDGAPAVFAGIDPSDGQFFVAKKGIFNKNPKIYKSIDDVRADTSGDLADKLSIAYTELQKLGIKGVLQGDIMFTQKDLSVEDYDGDKYITFQPNTIVYAVPADSAIAKTIKSAKIGVVFHTRYTGDSLETMKASYDFDASELKKIPSVWYQDAKVHDLSGKATLTAADTQEVTAKLSEAGRIFQKISGSTLKQIEENPEFAQSLETFNNTLVRKGQTITDTKKHVEDLISWAAARFEKDIESKKSDKGKEMASQKRDAYMSFFSDENKKNLDLVYQLQNAIIDAKKIIIAKLDALKKMKTFIRTKDGFRVTGQEGFVAIDHLKGGAVKLVDRMEFSKNNFSPDIIKGWDR